jgi:hypothetical protein
MAIYSSEPVELAPKVILSHWTIREAEDGRQFFVGYNETDCDGRVSTPIRQFDAKTRIGITTSGRTYVLVGPAGLNGDAEYVWSTLLKVWKVGKWRDVTSQVVPNFREALESIKSNKREAVTGKPVLLGAPVGNTGPDVAEGTGGNAALFWRARAFGMVFRDNVKTLNSVSEVRGECFSKEILRLQVGDADRYLYAIRATLLVHARDGQRIDSSAPLPTYLKIWVSALSRPTESVGRPLVRFDVFTCGGTAIFGFHSAQKSRNHARPFHIAETDGIWEVFLRALSETDSSRIQANNRGRMN